MTSKDPTIKFAGVLIAFGGVLFVSSCARYRDSNKSDPATPEPTVERPSPTPFDFADYYGYIKEASVTCSDLPSTEAANQALNSKLPHGERFDKVIKRDFKINDQGQRVGRRIITWSCCGVEGQSAAHIYWTDGSKLCDIISATVDQALTFEKSHKQ